MSNEEMLSYLDIPFKFWTCPDCEYPMIKWKGNLATCCNCRKTNKE